MAGDLTTVYSLFCSLLLKHAHSIIHTGLFAGYSSSTWPKNLMFDFNSFMKTLSIFMMQIYMGVGGSNKKRPQLFTSSWEYIIVTMIINFKCQLEGIKEYSDSG